MSLSPLLYMLLGYLAEEIGLSANLSRLLISAAPGGIELLSKELDALVTKGSTAEMKGVLDAVGRAGDRVRRYYEEHPEATSAPEKAPG